MTFSGERLRLARQRRKLTGEALAELAEVSSVTISRAENGHAIDEVTEKRIASALSYPMKFFHFASTVEINADTVSFRSLKKMGAAERNASLAAGALGVDLYDWVASKFHLPSPNLIDLSKERNRPESAARLLRQHWGLGERPVGNMLALLESKGVRVLSLCENTKNVDAYSFWRDERPYIFLNQEKTPERSIFDAAHELGHLVMHHHAGSNSEKGAEYQADRFASAFLMPEDDLKNQFNSIGSVHTIIRAKMRWRVSAMALAYRMHKLGLITDWTYRSFCIELGRLGYRSGEPKGIEREHSVVWAKILTVLWGQRVTKEDIADNLGIPVSELESLIFKLTASPAKPEGKQNLEAVG